MQSDNRIFQKYHQIYKRHRAEVLALAAASSSSEEDDHLADAGGERNSDNADARESLATPADAIIAGSSDFDSDLAFSSSSDSDLEDIGERNNDENKYNLREMLAHWACKNKVTRSTLGELLHILRNVGHSDLPKDPRTLLCTPRKVDVQTKLGGQYVYFGIESGVQRKLTDNPSYKDDNDSIVLHVNIDGVPLFKSTSDQFWPIMVRFGKFPPFVIALFFGKSKPQSLDGYLTDFLEEYARLKESGIEHEGKVLTLSIGCFICDAPARSFLKAIIGHTGYHSCERCTITGTWNRRIILHSSQPLPKRTDEEFNQESYKDSHQVRSTPLIDYDIPCITGFCLDYMHLVCLGVMRRMLIFMKKGTRISKLSNQQIGQISKNLMDLNGQLPAEFARQPRSLQELDRYKATEFRQLLLYTGPVVLKGVISSAMYEHFLHLSVAMSILLDDCMARRQYYLPFARKLLERFVANSRTIYGDIFVVYNVHSLSHIADDAENHQCSLNAISAFPYENYLQTIKRFVRKATNPIAQVAKRLTEMEEASVSLDYENTHFRYISTKEKDSCFLTENEDFVFVREKRSNGDYVCHVVKQQLTQNFFMKPCESKLLNIAFLRDGTNTQRRILSNAAFRRKVVCLPYRNGRVLIPMLHGDERYNCLWFAWITFLFLYFL